MPEDHSQLKREIIELMTQQIEVLRTATFPGMTTQEWNRESATRIVARTKQLKEFEAWRGLLQ